MKLISNLQDIDRKAVQQEGIPAEALMETAGTKVAEVVQAHADKAQVGVMLCGPGNNGGDGFVCARKLYEAGFHALTVIYTGQRYQAEALANLERLMISFPIQLMNAKEQPELVIRHLKDAAFVVDALFGSGLARPIMGLEARLVEAINESRLSAKPPWVVSVDLPSGLDSDSGQILGCAVQADATVTFASPKPGLYLYPGKAYVGQLTLADIGIPPYLIDQDESLLALITRQEAKQWLPPRLPDSHKYRYGHVLVIAGSHAMPGASVLCAEAAMSSGAGLVTLAAPAQVFEQLLLMPEVMRLPLPDAAQLGEASVAVLQEALAGQKYNTVVLGPGLGQSPETQAAILVLLNHLKALGLPVLVDADGLNALSQNPIPLSEQFVLTPHVGECARLLGLENQAVSAHLTDAASQVRQKYGAQVVLKSASTLVATLAGGSENLLWISPTGNPGMATAGSGDVLSGIIGAMLAQVHAAQRPLWQAVTLGVYLHGLSGDLAAVQLTPHCMRASHITHFLPQAFQQVL